MTSSGSRRPPERRPAAVAPPALAATVQKSPRYACELAVDVLLPLESQFRMLPLLNLSRTGAFLRCDRFVAPGTMLRVRTTLFKEPVALMARVVHFLEPERAGVLGVEAGAGLVFDRLSERARELIAAYVLELHRATMVRDGAVDGLLPPPRAPLPLDS